MPRPTRAKRSSRQRSRTENGHFLPSITYEAQEEWEFLGLSEDSIASAYQTQWLKWNDEAHQRFRGQYKLKPSRTTDWRKRKNIERLYEPDNNGKRQKSLFDYVQYTQRPSQDTNQHDLESHSEDASIINGNDDDNNSNGCNNNNDLLEAALDSLSHEIKPDMNRASTALEQYQFCRLKSIHCFLQYCYNGSGKMDASQKAAVDVWVTPSSDYRAKAIRRWAKEYLETGELSLHRQGVHVKRTSLLNDEYIKEKTNIWIRHQKPEKRSIFNVKNYLDNDLLKKDLNIEETVPLSTLWRYMYEWGYMFRKHHKDVYYDGHERPDVVEYRTKWAQDIMALKDRMESYDGDDEEIVIPPQTPPTENNRQVVMVTHDESTFYANDGKTDMWLFDGENPIRKKGPGRSIMVSEFQCPCHGTMRQKGWMSRKLFYAGTNRDGWWSSEDIVIDLVLI